MKNSKFTVIPEHLFSQLSESAQKEIIDILAKEAAQFEVDCKRVAELEQSIAEEKQRMEDNKIKTVHIDSDYMQMIIELETLKSVRSRSTDCEILASLLMGYKIMSRAWPEGSFIEIGIDGNLIDEKGEELSDLNMLIGFKLEAIL